MSRLPNYLEPLIRFALEGARPGRVTVAHIYHDDDCAHFEDGMCNCRPEIRFEEKGEFVGTVRAKS